MLKNLSAMQQTRVQSRGREDSLEKDTATHSSILAWRIPWAEEPHMATVLGVPESGTGPYTEQKHPYFYFTKSQHGIFAKLCFNNKIHGISFFQTAKGKIYSSPVNYSSNGEAV